MGNALQQHPTARSYAVLDSRTLVLVPVKNFGSSVCNWCLFAVHNYLVTCDTFIYFVSPHGAPVGSYSSGRHRPPAKWIFILSLMLATQRHLVSNNHKGAGILRCEQCSVALRYWSCCKFRYRFLWVDVFIILWFPPAPTSATRPVYWKYGIQISICRPSTGIMRTIPAMKKSPINSHICTCLRPSVPLSLFYTDGSLFIARR